MPHDTSRLRIVRTRRAYNRWAADQTFEDYALRFTARSARTATPMRAALTALGSISFLALEAIGGTLTLTFGFANTVIAIAFVTIIIFCITLPLCATAAKAGLDVDLLTRGTGFGYIGSTVTSLIYASFTFIFFGLEAAILAGTLHILLNIPLWLAYLACAVIIIPLVARGITFIAKFQIITLPIWFVLNSLPLFMLAIQYPQWITEWTHFSGLAQTQSGIDILAIGSAASVMIVLVCQSAEQIDFLRFLPPLTTHNKRQWWSALILGGPGWIVLDAGKLLAGSFLGWMALHVGFSPLQATQPGLMYHLAWSSFTSPALATALTIALVAVSQVKINITNAYAGSLAWSNFFSRLTHSHPGRVFYVLFNLTIALILMEAGLVNTIQTGITFYAVLACAWIGVILGDVTICKSLKLCPPEVEFKRSLLPDLNSVGIGAWALGAGIGTLALSGFLGQHAAAFAPFLTLFISCGTTPLLAWLTHGRTYMARRQPADWNAQPAMRCVICEHEFEAEDMTSCPAYGGTICSLCCSLDGRCHDRCKPISTHLSYQLTAPLRALPTKPRRLLVSPGGRFASLLICIMFVLGLLAHKTGLPFDGILLIVFLASVIGAWLLIMAQEGRKTATRETLHQTRLLMNEIRARRRMDQALQSAREKAEAASLAKTRYISGISHEIRSPLNAIMGYIQLLQHDARIPPARQQTLSIMRESGDHITSILSGLLDISRIEAGRIELHSDTIPLATFLNSVAQMMRPQAQAKGLKFYWKPQFLPSVVTCDEHRLRQVLLNLLSNAIKYTQHGSVTFSARWNAQIAEFTVEDTGAGISPKDQERIFDPFERAATTANIPGTGLGLTITKLLTEVMGGELTFTSTIGKGSCFRLRLMLPDKDIQLSPILPSFPIGYEGPQRTIGIVDDNSSHRQIMRELLERCGFSVRDFESGQECLDCLDIASPDLLLLDLSMPKMDGRELALRIRQKSDSHIHIMFLTGNLVESANRHVASLEDCAVIGKPVNLSLLIQEIGKILDLNWIFQKTYDESKSEKDGFQDVIHRLPEEERLYLLKALNGGNLKQLRERLSLLQSENPALQNVIAPLAKMAATYQLEALRIQLEQEEA